MVPKEEVNVIARPDVLVPESNEDKELVLAFKRGEEGSYQAIYERYSPKVQGICRRLLINPSDADEARQEVFMRVYTGLPNFNGRYQLGAWVSRIATNVCLDHLRTEKRRPADCADHDTLVALQDSTDDDDPAQLFVAADDHKRVRSILSSLSPMHRAAIALREFEGMSYAEIALALGMTEPQVKALLHRARKSFRRSWMQAGLAALLPWKLIAKLRRAWEPAVGHHPIADAAATSTIHFSTACSSMLASCGQFITERMAPVATAVIFGGAAVASNVLPSRDHAAADIPRIAIAVAAPERDIERADVAVAPTKKNNAPKENMPKGRGTVAAPAEGASEPQPEAPPPAQPAPQPTAPAAGAAPPSAGGDKPQQNPTPTPTGPQSLSTYFGWVGSEPIPRAEASSQSARIDCDNQMFDHSVTTLISHGAFSYKAEFKLRASRADASLDFTVYKDNRDIRYASWGAEPVVLWARDGSSLRLEITGDYGAIAGYDPASAGLPQSGHFDSYVTLDCAAHTVVSEGATFTAE